MSSHRYFVTGGTGFVGTHLIRFLKNRNLGSVTATYLDNPDSRIDGVDYLQLNISNSDDVKKAIAQSNPTHIIHLAAVSNPSQSWNQIRLTFDVNLGGTLRILEAVRDLKTQCKVLFVSTNQVYGNAFYDRKVMRESDAVQPTNPYSVSKYLGERLCLQFVQEYGLDIRIARPFNHYGEGQEALYVFSHWAKQVAESEKNDSSDAVMVGNVEVLRDILSVHDVIRAYSVILEKGIKGAIYNVCTGAPTRLGDALDLLLKMSKNKQTRYEMNPSLVRADDLLRTQGDPSQLNALGWSTEVKIDEGLAGLLNDWRKRLK